MTAEPWLHTLVRLPLDTYYGAVKLPLEVFLLNGYHLQGGAAQQFTKMQKYFALVFQPCNMSLYQQPPTSSRSATDCSAITV